MHKPTSEATVGADGQAHENHLDEHPPESLLSVCDLFCRNDSRSLRRQQSLALGLLSQSCHVRDDKAEECKGDDGVDNKMAAPGRHHLIDEDLDVS